MQPELRVDGEINVLIGQVKKGRGSAKLQAILGSCVGIILIDRKHGNCTLSHSLLPRGVKLDTGRRGKWVNHAIVQGLGLLKAHPRHCGNIEAVLAGGSTMVSRLDVAGVNVGEANVRAAEETLAELGIKVIEQSTGGLTGRKISVVSNTLDFTIEDIPRASAQ